jgi:hypothetical protein
MTSCLEGRVAIVTGADDGLRRTHALKMSTAFGRSIPFLAYADVVQRPDGRHQARAAAP